MISTPHRILSFRHGAAAVLGVAAIIRIVYLVYYSGSPDWYHLTVDNHYHHNWAQVIAGGNLLGDETYFRAPFYVYCLAALYWLFGASLWVGRIFGLAIGIASVGATYLLGKRLFSNNIGLFAALGHALMPIAVYFEMELLLDPLFTLLLQLAFLACLRWIDKRDLRSAMIAGLLLGLAAITRPTALILVPIMGAACLWGAVTPREAIKQSAVFVLGMALLIGPIFARNLAVGGDPTLIASQGGINLYIGNNDVADGVTSQLPEPLGLNWRLRQINEIAKQAEGRNLGANEVSAYWGGQAIDWAIDNPKRFLRLYTEKLYHCISSREISNNRSLPRMLAETPVLRSLPLSFGLVFPFAVLGAFKLMRKRRLAFLVLGSILATVAVTALFFVSSRFRLPLIPYYLILATAGVGLLFSETLYSLRRGLPLAAAAAIVWLFVSVPVAPLPKPPVDSDAVTRGLFHHHRGERAEAFAFFKAAADAAPDYPEVNLNLGAAFLRLGMTDSARYYLERERELHPRRPRVYVNLSSLRMLDGDSTAALRLAEQALSLEYWDVDANKALMRAASGANGIDADSLWAIANTVGANTADNPTVLTESAIIMTNRGELDRADRLLRRALAASPPPVEIDDRAFGPDYPGSPANWSRAMGFAHYQLGYVSGLRGLVGEAVDHSCLAIKADSNLARAYVNLVTGYRVLSRFEAADSVLAEATRRFPDDPLVEAVRRRR